MKPFETFFFDASQAATAQLRSAVRTSAVLHLRGNLPADQALLPFYTNLLARLGNLELRGEDLQERSFPAGQWLDIRYDQARADSFRHSNTRQPLHTDGAYINSFEYDVVVLACEQSAGHGGATHFIDAEALVELLTLDEPELLDELRSREVIFSKDGMGTTIRRVIDHDQYGWLLNWNVFRVAEVNTQAVRVMVEEFHRFLEHRVVDAGLVQGINLQPGEALFLHDRRALHGRYAFFGARCLHKAALRL